MSEAHSVDDPTPPVNDPPAITALAQLDTVHVPPFPGQEGIRAKYPRPLEVGEISGFGGGYEATCVNMMYAALQVIDESTTTEKLSVLLRTLLLQHKLKREAGEDSEAPTYETLLGKETMEKVEAAMMLACHRDCTGAMHGAALAHAFQCVNLGSAEYIRHLTEHRTKERAEGHD